MIKWRLAAVACLWAGAAAAVCVPGDGAWIDRVCYSDDASGPLYGHTILGDTPEWSELVVFYGPEGTAAADGNRAANAIFPAYPGGFADGFGIFEDTAPRLVDVSGNGRLDAIVVESSSLLGARLAIYEFTPEPRLLAATPHIGQRNRWFAPIGAADLDGDGHVEVAFVDRPHLARTLRVWRYADGDFAEVAVAAGVTNHRIGEPDIAGGIRDCGSGPEMIVASANWTRLLAVTLSDGQLTARDIGSHRDRSSFAAAMACDR